MTARTVAIGVSALLAWAMAAPAQADFASCTYDAATRTVTATLDGGAGGLYVAAGGAIRSGSPPAGGTQCGAATTANTDRIDVRGQETLAAETATIDNSGPGGAFRKAGTSDEIEIHADLGEPPWTYEPDDVGAQTLKLVGTPGADEIRAGGGFPERAVNMDAQSDATAEVHPVNVSMLDLDGAGGDDHVTALGGTGTVEQYAGVAVLRGGPGDDRLVGNNWANVLYPGGGYDSVDGGGQIRFCYPCDVLRDGDLVSYEDAPAPVDVGYPFTHGNDDGWGNRDEYTDVEGIRGSGFADRLEINGAASFLLDGAGGGDEVLGGYQADRLYGGAGDDHLRADPSPRFERDRDQLDGGPGDDVLDGGQDPDYLFGGAGDDVLNAGAIASTEYDFSKQNVLEGGAGSDALNGAGGDETYLFMPPAGAETDTLREAPGQGRDRITVRWGEPLFGEPATDHVLDLSSATTALGSGGTRELRVAEAGQAANLEDVETGFGADQVTGNAAVNHISTGPGADLVKVRDAVADVVSCGYDSPAEDPDTAVVDALDEVEGCETVDRPAPSPGPGGGDDPGETPPPGPPAGPAPPAPTGFATSRAQLGRSVFAMRLPRACVAPAARHVVRISGSERGSSTLSARLVRATFTLGGRRIAIDSRSPFSARLPAALAPGRHSVSVRLLLKPVRRQGGRTRVGRFTMRTLAGVVHVCG
jgi:Ca2+-binding RTX toxin-like protein